MVRTTNNNDQETNMKQTNIHAHMLTMHKHAFGDNKILHKTNVRVKCIRISSGHCLILKCLGRSLHFDDLSRSNIRVGGGVRVAIVTIYYYFIIYARRWCPAMYYYCYYYAGVSRNKYRV